MSKPFRRRRGRQRAQDAARDRALRRTSSGTDFRRPALEHQPREVPSVDLHRRAVHPPDIVELGDPVPAASTARSTACRARTPAPAGLLYNKKVYEDLGLSVPTTWDEFAANNEAIKAAGIAPVGQTYGGSDTWTSQLFVLADNCNVLALTRLRREVPRQ